MSLNYTEYRISLPLFLSLDLDDAENRKTSSHRSTSGAYASMIYSFTFRILDGRALQLNYAPEDSIVNDIMLRQHLANSILCLNSVMRLFEPYIICQMIQNQVIYIIHPNLIFKVNSSEKVNKIFNKTFFWQNSQFGQSNGNRKWRKF